MIANPIAASRRRSTLGSMLVVLLAGVALTWAPAPTAKLPLPTAPTTAADNLQSERNVEVAHLLDKRVATVKFDKTPLGDVIDYIRGQTQAQITVNWDVLRESGVDIHTPISAYRSDVKFSKALDLALRAAGEGKVRLGWRIRDGAVVISAADDLAKDTITTSVYDIRDILVEGPDSDAPRSLGEPAATQTAKPNGDIGAKPRTRQERAEAIIKLIKDTVASDTWRDDGGSIGTIRELSGQLIVTQTPENHAAIVNLLGQLREQRYVQVTLEVRFISCDEQLTHGLIADWLKPSGDSVLPRTSATTRPATDDVEYQALPNWASRQRSTILDAAQVNQLLQAAKASPGTFLLAEPRITLFNGQHVNIGAASQSSYVRDYAATRNADGQWHYEPVRAEIQPGLFLDVTATVAADRKWITLTLRPQASALLGMREVAWPSRPAGSNLMVQVPEVKSSEFSTTLSIPDCSTLLLGGMEDPGLDRNAESPAATPATAPVAAKPRLLFVLVNPTLVMDQQTSRPKPSGR